MKLKMTKHNERNNVFFSFCNKVLEVLLVLMCVTVVLCNSHEVLDDCQTLKLDLVIIVDTSTSVGETNFILSLDFVRNILKPLPIGADSVRVALLRYSTDVKVVSYMNEHMTRDEKIQAVSYINYTKGLTYTNKVLQMTRTKILVPNKGDRSRVKDLVILITDGQSTKRRETVKEAIQLKNITNLKLFTIGVTKEIDEVELKNISSSTDMFLLIENFTDLNNHLGIITPIVCSGGAQGITSLSSANISISESSNSRTVHDKLNNNVNTTLHILGTSLDGNNRNDTVNSESVSKPTSILSSGPVSKETSYVHMLSQAGQSTLSGTMNWITSTYHSTSELSSPGNHRESTSLTKIFPATSMMSLSSSFVTPTLSSLPFLTDSPTQLLSSPSATRLVSSSSHTVTPVSSPSVTQMISTILSPYVSQVKPSSLHSVTNVPLPSVTPVTSLLSLLSPFVSTHTVSPSVHSVTHVSSTSATSISPIVSSLRSSASSYLSPSSTTSTNVKSTLSPSSVPFLTSSTTLPLLMSSPLNSVAMQYVTPVISSYSSSSVTSVTQNLSSLPPSVTTYLPVQIDATTTPLHPVDKLSVTPTRVVSSYMSHTYTSSLSSSFKSHTAIPSSILSSEFPSLTLSSMPSFHGDDYPETSTKSSLKSTIITSSISEDNHIRPTSTQQTLPTSRHLWSQITSSEISMYPKDQAAEDERMYATYSSKLWSQSNNSTHVSNSTTFRDVRNKTFDVYLIATGAGFITIVTTGILLGVICRKLKSKSRKVN